MFVSVERASRMIVIFTASHEDKFQRTPKNEILNSKSSTKDPAASVIK